MPKYLLTIKLEREIELSLENFEDCSEEGEMLEAAVDQVEQEDFSVEIGDETFDFSSKQTTVTIAPVKK